MSLLGSLQVRVATLTPWVAPLRVVGRSISMRTWDLEVWDFGSSALRAFEGSWIRSDAPEGAGQDLGGIWLSLGFREHRLSPRACKTMIEFGSKPDLQGLWQ